MSSDQHRSRHRASRFAHRPGDDAAYAPSSPSSSEHSDMSSHSYHSSSRRVLAQVLARKERDAQQMHQLLKLTFAKLDEESQRATDAERRATECLVRARAAIDARAQSDADATAARAELALYKVQLEQAQREISRAQDYLDGLEARRHDAEQDAARARSVARKLQEERTIEVAREEGKQQGWHEGLRQGMLLGRREAENELRSRPRRHGLGDARFTPVTPEPLQHGTSERWSPDDLPSRGLPRPRASSRRTPEIVPVSPAPSVPIRAAPFRRSPEQPSFSSAAARLDEQPYDSPSVSVSETSPSISPPPSRSRPRPETPALEPAHSRPYTPHDDSTPSIIQPIPIPASASSIGALPFHPSPSPSPRHPSVRIPPDNWIPRAQDTAGDGRLSIYLPPPHELIEPVRVPEGPYAIAATPEDGSPAVIPPPPIFPSSPGPSTRRSPDHTYTYATHTSPDLGSAVRAPKGSRSREYVYAGTPPPPDLGPAARPRDDYATAPLPPPPNLAPTSDERYFLPPQGITQIASINSRASTHLSEFDLLAPVDQPRQPSNIGPPPAEEDELEYVDAQTESIPRRPIAPDPPLQRRRAHAKKTSSRGPPRPRNVVLPAPLSQPRAQPAVPSHPQYVLPPPVTQQPHGVYMPPRRPQDEDDAQATAISTRRQRSHTQSSIGISVEPPSPDDSPPSSGNKTQPRLDLLSPEHAERPLPMSIMENFIPRNKPQPAPPQEERPLAPLPELAGISPDFAPLPGALPANIGDSRYSARSHSANRYMYEAAPVPAGIEYPASPLQAAAYSVPGKMRAGESDAPLSPLSIPSGFLGLKNRLPWRRNTAK